MDEVIVVGDGICGLGLASTIETVTPIQDILKRPAIRAAIEAVGDGAPMDMPGPDRAQLLDLLT